MNTLILYASKHGITKKYAKDMASNLFPQGHIQNVKSVNRHHFSQFDTIVLGTPIYSGQPRPEMREFCRKFHADLLTKQLYLFVTGLASAGLARRELLDAFPTTLHNHAKGKIFLGGAIDYAKLTFLEKGVVNLLPKEEFQLSHLKQVQQLSRLNQSAFQQFAQSINPLF